VPLPTVLVSRRPRSALPGWAGARSWLGGTPTLGTIAWPRGADGRPSHFLAQLDLGELAAAAVGTGLPDAGALAFFVGGGVPVVFVPPETPSTPTFPPADTPGLSDTGGEWRSDLDGRPIYPRWPVSFAPLDLPPVPDDDDSDAVEAYLAAQAAAVDAVAPRRSTSASPKEAFAGPPLPDWWHAAHFYSAALAAALRGAPAARLREERSLAAAREAGSTTVSWLEKKVARMRDLEPAFAAFVAEVAALAAGRDPWTPMTPDERERLADLWARNREFDLFHHNSGKFPLAYLQARSVEALPAAGTPGWEALPDDVRARLAVERAPRPQWAWQLRRYARSLEDAATVAPPAHAKRHRDVIASLRSQRARLPASSPKVPGLEAALAKEEGALAGLLAAVPAFAVRAAQTAVWAASSDPWAPLPPEGLAALKERMARDHADFPVLAGGWVPRRVEDLERAALHALATADDRGYATLPAATRDWIDTTQRLPAGGWHQLFGRGVEIQGDASAMREEGYVLLLQLVADPWMTWSFGDAGAYTFWIRPDDLARGRWSAAKLVFECH
jgi:hypothetical protein